MTIEILFWAGPIIYLRSALSPVAVLLSQFAVDVARYWP
jgi:hypothetical protein